MRALGSGMLRTPLLLIMVLAAVGLEAQTPAPQRSLFDGKSLAGWSLVTTPAVDIASVIHVTKDGTMAVDGKPVGYLLAAGSYENYRLHVEWRWPADAKKNSNSGFLIHISTGPIDRVTWPKCVQVQTKLTRAGDLLPMAGFKFKEPLSTAPDAKTPQRDRLNPSSEKPLGEWNSCDIVCYNGTLECSVNGVLQNKVSGCDPSSGAIGVQLEGTPYELRSISLTPL